MRHACAPPLVATGLRPHLCIILRSMEPSCHQGLGRKSQPYLDQDADDSVVVVSGSGVKRNSTRLCWVTLFIFAPLCIATSVSDAWPRSATH